MTVYFVFDIAYIELVFNVVFECVVECAATSWLMLHEQYVTAQLQARSSCINHVLHFAQL